MERAKQFIVQTVLTAAPAVGLLCVWVFADNSPEVSELPEPRKVGKMSLEESLASRCSIHRFRPEAHHAENVFT